ncbi:MAG: hypothetical protein NC821_02915 [Candidatus Omnitrophica bacterium]|nr:hypothetical protein [Candidatus Omnitrophota bacterium]
MSYEEIKASVERNTKIERGELNWALAMAAYNEVTFRTLFQDEGLAGKFQDLAMRLIKNMVAPGSNINI